MTTKQIKNKRVKLSYNCRYCNKPIYLDEENATYNHELVHTKCVMDLARADERENHGENCRCGYSCQSCYNKGCLETEEKIIKQINEYFDKQDKQVALHVDAFGKGKNRDIDNREKFTILSLPLAHRKNLLKELSSSVPQKQVQNESYPETLKVTQVKKGYKAVLNESCPKTNPTPLVKEKSSLRSSEENLARGITKDEGKKE